VKIILSHRIALDPTPSQKSILRQAVGCARFAYNWALREWQDQYEQGGRPNERELLRFLNNLKRDVFPWMLEIPKSVVQQAVKNLGTAFDSFFKKRGKYPRFKKRGVHDSARFDNGPGTFAFDGRRVKLPKLGWIKTREELRFAGRPLSATVVREADRWYVSVTVEVEHVVPEREPSPVGIDLGVTTACVLSTGEKFDSPKPLKRLLGKLRRASRHHSRKQRGSANRRKSARRLGRIHARISAVRRDWLHKTTTAIVRRFGVIGIEDLNVSGMVRNRHLSRAISDIGWGEFRRQLDYKSALQGAAVVPVDRFFPSSKLCSRCGALQDKLPLSVREWECGCGAVHDRDVNAALNIRRSALAAWSCRVENACGVEGSGLSRKSRRVKPAAKKQVPNRVS
jgi:putative transposase